MSRPVRTRFAPSPTGFLHVGNIRTGLFAWLIAQHLHGTFILRLEDTDKKREVEGSADHLIQCLKILGISYSEGPDIGGPFAPYKQSDRLDIYKAWGQKLIDAGRAYADPYPTEQLEMFREEAKQAKKAFLYRDHRPAKTPIWDGSQPLRFRSEPKPYTWHDEVMGDLATGPEVIDDIVLIKSDGFPTYNFAHIVDDAEMEITHIIRGQEFIASQPNYFNIYEALDLTPPIFATVPHILASTGGKKLGKRDGAKDVLDYIREGIIPEALVNFIASLGWNDGTEQEIFTSAELIEKFTLDRIQRSGARFDEQRLIWMNGQWIRRLSLDDLYQRATEFWSDHARAANDSYRKQVLALAQDRLRLLTDLPQLTDYFFYEPIPKPEMIQNDKQLKKLSQADIISTLKEAKTHLETTEFTADVIQTALNTLLEITGKKPGVLFSLIRLSVSWAPFSPALHETLAVLGKETVLQRLNAALTTFEK